jgi:hypothetical protein
MIDGLELEADKYDGSWKAIRWASTIRGCWFVKIQILKQGGQSEKLEVVLKLGYCGGSKYPSFKRQSLRMPELSARMEKEEHRTPPDSDSEERADSRTCK